ncbi:tyrosine-type recombinase/integrase [Herbaspirillum huttiense]|jgi:integrase/recombinase XerD|uniref:tyrosine-type recombinase/integrase n=1 Tax=Herbaspirillum TaxID=963 RepID=UPI0009815A24|nr:tyrosine-type recombinase/integrase [Herbaspirillum sp. VT-16-41]ONN63802.1 hypothetical protein BTM36_25540 [Herbaspirillum sp. VT-16-41]
MDEFKPVDLFATRRDWDENPREAFRAYVGSIEFVQAGKRGKNGADTIRESSAAVYISMFERFMTWIETRNRSFTCVTQEEIKEFLDLRDENGKTRLTSKIRMVYVRLLERAYDHLNVDSNPAKNLAVGREEPFRRGKEKAKVILKVDDIQRLMKSLPAAPAWNENSKNKRQRGWETRRNRALIAVLIGAGLKVSEAASLKLRSMKPKRVDGKIEIDLEIWDGTGTGMKHTAVIEQFAVPEIETWLRELGRMDLPSDLVFPGTIDTADELSKPTIYRLITKTLDLAGINTAHSGGRTLRNTYAAQQLVSTNDIGKVGEKLGHRERRATEMYLDAAKKFAEDGV